MEKFLNSVNLPFCKGCGHTTIAQNTEKALQKLGKNPLDVVLVTDIGCHGIIDQSFNCHTVHGLHGRSMALGAGVSAGLNNPDKKVIVFVGDGGCTIGMQHLIDAAHRNFNMTIVIHNNMLYGMTGGQPSEFTPKGFKTPTAPEGVPNEGYNICQILTAAGAAYVRRVVCIGDFSDIMAEAFSRQGLSVLELMEVCPSYGMKANPGMKLNKTVADAHMEVITFADHEVQSFHTPVRETTKPLFSDADVIAKKFDNNLQHPVRISICGSAGEGVQSTAEMLAVSAIKAGLHVTKKGNYPVTVGIGFSNAEVIISPQHISYTGSVVPDYMIVVSYDGLEYGANTLAKMTGGKIYLDESLAGVPIKTEVEVFPFRQKAGARNAAMSAVFHFLKDTRIFDLNAMIDTFSESKLSAKIPLETLL